MFPAAYHSRYYRTDRLACASHDAQQAVAHPEDNGDHHRAQDGGWLNCRVSTPPGIRTGATISNCNAGRFLPNTMLISRLATCDQLTGYRSMPRRCQGRTAGAHMRKHDRAGKRSARTSVRAEVVGIGQDVVETCQRAAPAMWRLGDATCGLISTSGANPRRIGRGWPPPRTYRCGLLESGPLATGSDDEGDRNWRMSLSQRFR